MFALAGHVCLSAGKHGRTFIAKLAHDVVIFLCHGPCVEYSCPCFPFSLAAAGTVKLAHDAVMFLGPFLLEQLLRHLQARGSGEWRSLHS